MSTRNDRNPETTTDNRPEVEHDRRVPVTLRVEEPLQGPRRKHAVPVISNRWPTARRRPERAATPSEARDEINDAAHPSDARHVVSP